MTRNESLVSLACIRVSEGAVFYLFSWFERLFSWVFFFVLRTNIARDHSVLIILNLELFAFANIARNHKDFGYCGFSVICF